MKYIIALSIVLFSILHLCGQDYDIKQDLDRDGVIDSEDKDPQNKNIPYDSVFHYTFCSNKEAYVDLWAVFPGLEMKWDSCSAYDTYTGYGKRFNAQPDVIYYSTLYDTISETPLRRLAHKFNIGDEGLVLAIDTIEQYSLRKKKGVKIILQDLFDDYSWEINGSYHGDNVMQVATFFENGNVVAIGYDKFNCKDTLEIELVIDNYYEKQLNVDVVNYFNPVFQKFKDLESAKGIVDFSKLSGLYDGPYTYYLPNIIDGPELIFKDKGIYHEITLDSKTQNGVWKYGKETKEISVNSIESKYEISINEQGETLKGQLIKLDDSLMRIYYDHKGSKRIVDYYRVKN